jgi:RimJ/RimL family protein N-acetyltransferase
LNNITTLSISDLSQHKSAFSSEQLTLVIDSICEGHTKAEAWRIEHEYGPAYLLWEQANNTFYLSQCMATFLCQDSLAELVASEIVPRAAHLTKSAFKLRTLDPLPDAFLQSCWPGMLQESAFIRLYRYDKPMVAKFTPKINAQIVSIDRALLENENIAGRGWVREEIEGMWPSLEDFYQHGFGAAALVDQRIVSACTAEFMSERHCGIGIATHHDYRQKGLASLCATNFLHQALAKINQPYWECNSRNLPSLRLAEKLGFRVIEEATVWIGSFVN